MFAPQELAVAGKWLRRHWPWLGEGIGTRGRKRDTGFGEVEGRSERTAVAAVTLGCRRRRLKEEREIEVLES